MSKNRRTFTPEYKNEVAKMVVEESRAVATVARELGINEQTLRNWVNKYRADHNVLEELSTPDRMRLREIEKQLRDVRMENEFLKKAAAFFAKECR